MGGGGAVILCGVQSSVAGGSVTIKIPPPCPHRKSTTRGRVAEASPGVDGSGVVSSGIPTMVTANGNVMEAYGAINQ